MILYLVIAAVSVMLAAGIGKMQKEERAAQAQTCCGAHPAGGVCGITRAEAAERVLLLALFLVLFIPAALRQQTGNDYMRYVEFFHLASVDAYVPTEEGFNLFVTLIYRLCGYENYLLVFALFAFVTILLFLAAIRQQAEDFAMSFFLFMMSGCYFQTYNTVRYYLALAIALFSLKYFLDREYVWFVLLVLLAASFHRSVLVVLVLYPVAAAAWKTWELALTVLLGGAFYATRNFWMKVIVRLYPSYEGTDILAAGGSISLPNVARCALVLLLALFVMHERKEKLQDLDRRMRFYLGAAFFSLEIYVFGSFIPELSRICYYLVTTQIFFIPALLAGLPERKQKRVRVLVVIAAAVVFAFFLRRAWDTDIRILPYRTFLFHDLPDTPSRSIE